eukprot:3886657-Prymnesium_polylepis.1
MRVQLHRGRVAAASDLAVVWRHGRRRHQSSRPQRARVQAQEEHQPDAMPPACGRVCGARTAPHRSAQPR